MLRIASTVADPTPTTECLSQAPGDEVYDAIFHPHCERLLAHCDAVLRIGGASAGADRMVAAAEGRGLLIYRSLDEIPAVEP